MTNSLCQLSVKSESSGNGRENEEETVVVTWDVATSMDTSSELDLSPELFTSGNSSSWEEQQFTGRVRGCMPGDGRVWKLMVTERMVMSSHS